MLTKLFVTLVHHTLEYYNLLWGQIFALNQRKVERFSIELQDCYYVSIRDKPYGERFLILQLPSLVAI